MQLENNTNFGFTVVPEQEKQKLVGGVFSSVANSYDLMNDLMSLGLHRMWKREFVEILKPRNNEVILDMAGGTGDITKLILNAAPECEVITADINLAMLNQGKARVINENWNDHPHFSCMNAEVLPFADESFDAYTIAFGIRNVTRIEKALSEAYRVLKPGGRFFCLEFSNVESESIRKLYDVYSFKILPFMGRVVAKDEAAYRYLAESIAMFPDAEKFANLITQAGFSMARYRKLTLGVVAIHSGWRV